MALQKDVFRAIVQTNVESITKNFVGAVVSSKLIELRKSSSPALVEEILKQEAFKDICNILYRQLVLNLKWP